MTRKTQFANGEHYHIYNRGVEKRDIFSDNYDLERFFQSLIYFNTVEPIGSIYEQSYGENNNLGGFTPKSPPTVEIVAYCLNPNHYHLILRQIVEGGISSFIKRLAGGYTTYFNQRHRRSGALFQGTFKSVHVNSNTYLLHLSAYVNLNNQLGGETPKLSRSSWQEYLEGENESRKGLCRKEIILDQFGSIGEYKKFALDSLKDIDDKKIRDRELQGLSLELESIRKFVWG